MVMLGIHSKIDLFMAWTVTVIWLSFQLIKLSKPKSLGYHSHLLVHTSQPIDILHQLMPTVAITAGGLPTPLQARSMTETKILPGSAGS